MLTREELGYGPGRMDAVFLCQDIDALDAALCSGGATQDDLLRSSGRLEEEARRLGVPDLVAKVLIQKAGILSARGCEREAIAALTEAEEVLGDLRQHDLKVRIYSALAEAHAQLQKWQDASHACQQGIRLVESHRHQVSGQYLQSAYLRSRIGLYSVGVQAAYLQKEYPLMLERAELAKCRSVMRQRRNGAAPTAEEERIERQFRDVCRQIDSARARDSGRAPDELLMKRRTLWDLLLIERSGESAETASSRFDLAAVQAVLAVDEAILYYFWISERTLLAVVIDREQVIAESREIPLEQRQNLERYSRAIFAHVGGQSLTSVDEVRDFAPWLLPRDARCLEGKRRLLISPHRLLHALPFHALPWDDEHRYLIERFAVTYIPNLSSLLLPYEAPAEQSLLALGVCDYQVPGEELASLRDAELEVGALGELYAARGVAATALPGAEACESEVHRLEASGKLAAYSCLHLATHGENVNSDTPMESHLFLQDSKLEGLEIANMQLGAELVVLSACCSGQRAIGGRGMNELPGDDLLGLQAAFFAAGARRVVGSLWPVHSEVARSLMLTFHHCLLAGQSPEVALQSATVDHLQHARLCFRNTFYWGPFFLTAVGRPNRRPSLDTDSEAAAQL